LLPAKIIQVIPFRNFFKPVSLLHDPSNYFLVIPLPQYILQLRKKKMILYFKICWFLLLDNPVNFEVWAFMDKVYQVIS